MSESEIKPRYWIIVASKDHVELGKEGGFGQASHGKNTALKKLNCGDFVVYYSSKKRFGEAEKCQEFTGIGKILDTEAYQVEMSRGFSPFRRRIDFFDSVDVSIRKLLDDLEFIPSKRYWGFPFRAGFFEISKHDFKIIFQKMLKE